MRTKTSKALIGPLLLATCCAAWGEAAPALELTPAARITPAYPRDAAAKGISGFVEFEIVVNPDGTVKSARVTKAEPPGVFDASALKSIKEWRFHPQVVDGKAVESVGTQRIDFMMESSAAGQAREACEAAREPKRARISMSGGFQRRLQRVTGVAQGGDYAKAEAPARELVDKAATPFEKASAYQALGTALAGLARTDEAITAFQASLDTQALPWVVHDQVDFSIAQFHALAGRNDLARQLLEQHLRESCAPHPQARALLDKLSAIPAKPH